MAQKTIERVNAAYEQARRDYVNSIADLAARPQNVPYLYSGRVLENLRPLITDLVPSIQHNAAIAIGRMAGQNEKIAEEILRDNKMYKRAALYVLRSISSHSSDLAENLVTCGAMDSIMLCLEDFDPKVREAACWAAEYVAKHSAGLAQAVVDAAAVPMLIVCLREPELSLKTAAAATLSSICKHSLDLAQVCADCSAISCLAICAKNPDCRLKRQAFQALSEIAKHCPELAELVVEAEIFPDVLTQMAHTDEITKRNAAVLTREIVKHSVELAEFVVNFGGVAALVDMLERTEGATRLPAIMAIGYIGAQSDQMASAIISAKGMHHLADALCTEKEDHILAAIVWSIGQLGKHSPEHSKAAALNNVFMKMVKMYCCKASSDDLRQKTKHSLKIMLQKCTHLSALETLLEEAPLTILKYVLGQFSKVLPHDARARRLFVTTGGLRKVQQMNVEEGTPLYEYKAIINLCFPEEIVNYYSPAYSESLLKSLEVFEPKIPPDVLLADRSSSLERPTIKAMRCPYYEEPPEGEDYMPSPPIPEECDTDLEDEDEEGAELQKAEDERAGSLKPGEERTGSLKPGDEKTGSLKPEEERAGSIKSGGGNSGSLKPGEEMTESLKTEERTSSSKPGEDKTGSLKPGDEKTGSLKTEERTASSKPGEEKTGSLKPGEGRTSTLKTEERTTSLKSGEGRTGSLKQGDGKSGSLKKEELPADDQKSLRSSIGSKRKSSVSQRKKVPMEGIKSDGMTVPTVKQEGTTDGKWNNVNSAPAAMEIPLAEIGRRTPASGDTSEV